jgi:hypothetical protein
MPLYELTKDAIAPVQAIRFADAGLKERGDLQRVLREKIAVVCPNTLVVAEEFGQWEDSRRRIDLLGVDERANLVVIELKRTEDGGHMELQAVRYAAMISTLTFDRVVEIFAEHLERAGSSDDARSVLLDHLGWESPEDGEFAPAVRIVLASADFSKELTTAVMWLNEQGLDITCVRLRPYRLKDTVLVDVQQVVPLPEASEYTVQIRAKRQETRTHREQERDFTKFALTLGGKAFEPLNKRRSMLEVVRYLVQAGVSPRAILEALPPNVRNRRFVCLSGTLDADGVPEAIAKVEHSQDVRIDYPRYFHDEGELLYFNGDTWLLTKMWGITTQQSLEALRAAFPQHRISFEPVGSE